MANMGQVRVFLLKLWSQMLLPDSQHSQWLDTNTMNRSACLLLTRVATDRVSKNTLTKGRRGADSILQPPVFSHHSLLYPTFHQVSFQETGGRAGTQRDVSDDS